MNQNIKKNIWLLGVNLFISAFTFGGGYVVVPMIRRYFVLKKKLFSEEELIEMAAVAQSTPGAIAINLSSLAGYRTAGFAGAAISCIAAVLPPLIILGIVSAFYSIFISNAVIAAVLKGMEAGVAAVMVDLIVDMCAMILKEKNIFLSALIPAAFIANFIFQINAIYILIVCCLLCVVRVVLKKRNKQ
ncbi:MAG TPA: chromate transporter [Candidatus Alectryocaccobium stercorigallinarum]|nr:chromate transporter [Candidatus Alectryocaccobium stercorigallinarum]